MTKIKWLSFEEGVNPKGRLDQAFLEDLLNDVVHAESERVICVVLGKQYDYIDKINETLSKYEKVLVIVTSDEESMFDTEHLSHPDMIIYSQYPVGGKSKNVDLWLPIGYTPYAKTAPIKNKDLEWFFSGQITHETRETLHAKLSTMEGGLLLGTEGFTQGYPPEEYMQYMCRAIVAPSPHGAVKPEALRTYEALEVGAFPIPEGEGYHKLVTSDIKYSYSEKWGDLDKIVDRVVSEFPRYNNLVQSQWQLTKYRIRNRLLKDLGIQEQLTVLMSTSPIKSHPSTEKIEKVYESLRRHLPDAQVIIMADGVRAEQSHLDGAYQEYLRRIMTKRWHNTTVIVHEEHHHQLSMTRKVLKHVQSKNIMFLEHDIAFNERHIDFGSCLKLLDINRFDVIRFHFEEVIPEPHYYMMLDKRPIESGGVNVIRTAQWSQRPHIANTDYYRRVLSDYGTSQANCMIEDAVHGKIADETLIKKQYDNNRIAVYAPEGGYSRCYHLDGRENEDKYEDKQVF